MQFVYKINEDARTATITGVLDCPKSLTVPASILHSDKKEYLISQFVIGSMLKGKNENNLTCESILFLPNPNLRTIKIRRNQTLKEIVLPESVTELDSFAFFKCEGLKKVTISQGFLKIGKDSFRGCSNLEEIIFSETIKEIELNAFAQCTNLYRITLPNSIEKIGNYAFRGCTNLREAILPNNIQVIGDGVFDGCASLTSVVIPDSVTSIGGFAFAGCSNLEEIIIPDLISEIETRTFWNCTSLKRVKIPNSLARIGNGSFAGCTNLEEFILPKSIEKIEDFAFQGCVGLSHLLIYKEHVITPTSFLQCSSLKTLGDHFLIENGVLYNSDKTEMYTWLGSTNNSSVNIVAPSSVNVLGNGFSHCSDILSIDLSRTVCKAC